MPSSISSSRTVIGAQRASSKKAPWRCVAIFLASFLTLICFGRLLSSPVNARHYKLGEKGVNDYGRFFYGLSPVDRLKKADVVFLGGSRMLYAMRNDLLSDYFKDLSLSFFTFGFGQDEPVTFPLALLRKFEVYPRTVVVDVANYFRSQITGANQFTNEEGFIKFKTLLESKLTELAEQALFSILPIHFDLNAVPPSQVLRSLENGTWKINWEEGPGKVFSLEHPKASPPLAEELELAGHFMNVMRAQGANVILIHIPGPMVNIETSRVIARHLGLPLHSPRVGPLRSFDEQHLTRESAARFTSALLAELKPLF